MTAHKPGDPTTLNRLYGRSKGKPLRAGQQALVDELLPQIAVPSEGAVTAERLFGNDYYWSVLGAGRAQFPVATMAAAIGGNVRVGLEDSLWDGPGRLARSNADQVRRIVAVLKSLNLEVASPDEARRMLELKGQHAVAF